MSLGALSPDAHETLAQAMNKMGDLIQARVEKIRKDLTQIKTQK